MPRVVDRLIRDHVRYTGDGLPGEPVNAPLPIGDPSSGVYHPTKRDIREAIGDVEGDRIRAEAASALAQAAMVDAQGATLQAANRAALLANTSSYPVGTIFATRAEGHAYEVVASGGDEVTAGGVRLRRLRRDYETGHTVNLAGAAQPTDPGVFGGLFTALKSGQVIDWQSPVDAEAGPKFAFGITGTVAGGNANGPDHARGGLWLKVEKKNSLTTSQPGEIDGIYLQVRQGRKDDAGGILIHAEKVFTGTADDSGGLTPIEISSAKVDAAGATIRHVQVIPAFMEGLGGATQANGSGLYMEARAGAIDSGLHIIGRNDLPNNPRFSNILIATANRDPASRYFRISGLGEIFMGSPTDQISLRYDGGALHFRNFNSTSNLMSLDQNGGLGAIGGFYSPGVVQANFRNIGHPVNTLGKQPGLLRFDGVEWVFAGGSTPGAPWRKVSDPSVIAHQPV